MLNFLAVVVVLVALEACRVSTLISVRTLKGLQHMSASLDALQATVASNTSVIASAKTLIDGFSARLDAAIAAAKAGDDSAALDALSAELKASDEALAASVAANTAPTA